jgi:hypothetical protein
VWRVHPADRLEAAILKLQLQGLVIDGKGTTSVVPSGLLINLAKRLRTAAESLPVNRELLR